MTGLGALGRLLFGLAGLLLALCLTLASTARAQGWGSMPGLPAPPVATGSGPVWGLDPACAYPPGVAIRGIPLAPRGGTPLDDGVAWGPHGHCVRIQAATYTPDLADVCAALQAAVAVLSDDAWRLLCELAPPALVLGSHALSHLAMERHFARPPGHAGGGHLAAFSRLYWLMGLSRLWPLAADNSTSLPRQALANYNLVFKIQQGAMVRNMVTPLAAGMPYHLDVALPMAGDMVGRFVGGMQGAALQFMVFPTTPPGLEAPWQATLNASVPDVFRPLAQEMVAKAAPNAASAVLPPLLNRWVGFYSSPSSTRGWIGKGLLLGLEDQVGAGIGNALNEWAGLQANVSMLPACQRIFTDVARESDRCGVLGWFECRQIVGPDGRHYPVCMFQDTETMRARFSRDYARHLMGNLLRGAGAGMFVNWQQGVWMPMGPIPAHLPVPPP